MRGLIKLFTGSSFHMNAFYLMLATFVLAATGFLFWVIVARMYDTTSVGLATTILSVSTLLSLLGLAGFDTTLVRFLPRSEARNNSINSSLMVVTILTILLTSIVAVILPLVSPKLVIFHEVWFAVAFVFFTVVSSLNILTNAVFLAYKQARYIFIINALFGASKIVLLFLGVPGSEATIFIFVGVSQAIGLTLSLVWMKQKFDFVFLPQIDLQALRLVRKFSVSMYVSSILNLLPPTLIPLIIVAASGPREAAYYYMAFTIASVLYTVAYASMQSAFAEGSHDQASLAMHIKKAGRLIAIILIPGSVVLAFLSGFLLSWFGSGYVEGAALLLQVFAISALPVALYSALGAIFKVTKKLVAVVIMNVVYASVILVSVSLFSPSIGINAVGWAWALGNIAACLTGVWFLVKRRRGLKKVL